MNFKEKIVNALYAQAVADAVGNPFEFKYDIDGQDVIDYANQTKTLVISDDTQMALFGFEAVKNLEKYVVGGSFDQVKQSFTQSYLNWYLTQIFDENDLQDLDGLLSFKSVYSVQAPGNTCLSALYSLMNHKPVINKSKGCGSVMRLLPLVSLFEEAKYSLEYFEVIACAKITGDITHKHKANASAIEKYMFAANCIINDFDFIKCPDAGHISELGEGWIAPEAVDMAIWAYCHAKSFDELLALSISHDGDSDSVAAMAGALWGLSGKEVPHKYVDKLDALDAIEYIISKI